MAFLSYCEYKLTLLFYSPIYIICSILMTAAQQDEIKQVSEQVDEDMRYLIQDLTQITTTRAIFIAASLLSARYLQQLDVSQLIIKTWSSSNQENQLMSYFLN